MLRLPEPNNSELKSDGPYVVVVSAKLTRMTGMFAVPIAEIGFAPATFIAEARIEVAL
jgi:hypothetical protein